MEHVEVAQPLCQLLSLYQTEGYRGGKICTMPRAQRIRRPICADRLSRRQPRCLRNAAYTLRYNLAGAAGAHAHLPSPSQRRYRQIHPAVTANHRARSAKESGVPHIVTVPHQSIKQRAFVRRFTKTSRAALKRVRGEEMMRRLHHRQLFFFRNQPIVILQKRACRHMANRRSPQPRLSRVSAHC